MLDLVLLRLFTCSGSVLGVGGGLTTLRLPQPFSPPLSVVVEEAAANGVDSAIGGIG